MTLVLFGLFFLFMLLGVPIAFAIGASTLYALHQSGVPLMVVTLFPYTTLFRSRKSVV